MKQVVFVMGAAGAIGRHVVRLAREQGFVVGGIGYGPEVWSDPSGIDAWIPGAVSADALTALAGRIGLPATMINLAGGAAVGASFEDPLRDFDRAVTAAARQLDWIRRVSPDTRFVVTSSAAVYGAGHALPIAEEGALCPVSPYGRHKRLVEELVHGWSADFGIRSVIVRPFSVYGVGLHKQLVFEICGRLRSSPDLLSLWGSGDEVRDWLWIEDMARLLLWSADLASPLAPILNGCTGRGLSVREVAGLLVDAYGLSTKLAFNGMVRSGDPACLVGDPSRVSTLGFIPQVEPETGLRRVAQSLPLLAGS